MTAPATPAHDCRRVLLAGATGLVGRELLALLLADPSVLEVHTVGRRPSGHRHQKLQHHHSDLRSIPPLPRLDAVFIALGTTIQVAGSQQAFRAVDHDAVLAVAGAGWAAGARRLGVVSAMGADAHSRIFYNRVKGETEEALSALGYDSLVIARPSLLIGDRTSLGQPERRGEGVGAVISRWLRPLIPANYRAIRAERVARALVGAVVHAAAGRTLLPSGRMQRAH
ncbi:nucleoside-diphosphate sugar epimerase [Xenophilus arseniciresistens]|uniref:Nucleoside-diphosphate sugar epimerase n=1 Tax=Xenophilus arseniciresistens TaxID=1283306 RepID=A0AAE3NCK2_9BURK|nr:NAD-dependent epimerase/dehydratase family protein [Xenophilus arseniciresistens]MDA7419176.1 nucleoside-diphosphate sugar epimerase [Xenophilus arseniciresistens]